MVVHHVLNVVISVFTVVLPTTITIVWGQLHPIYQDSGSINENYSTFLVKMKTLCAVRDDLKNSTIDHDTSSEKRSMEDWYSRVLAVEEAAQELERKFRRRQGRLYVFGRAKYSKKMAKITIEIAELEKEGHQLKKRIIKLR